jgi:ParB family chromosome partitioning protein
MKNQVIEQIPIDQIRVVNPRSRNKIKWQAIVQSIEAIGLKRPITVCRRATADSDGKLFDLVCGQGRMEAFAALGQSTIPAVMVDAPEHDRHLMSLVENIARRPASTTAILQEVKSLRARGYKTEEIARKLGLDRTYIFGIAHLIDSGEDLLVEAVESGRIPLTVAIEIAAGNDQEVSRALSEAYDKGELLGHEISAARRITMQRIMKHRHEGKATRELRKLTGESLVREYKQKVREQRTLIAKASRTKEQLILFTSVFRALFADENFRTLLRAEGLNSVPAELAARLK